jgi:sorbitol-specific phosphotransferase system component IIBC
MVRKPGANVKLLLIGGLVGLAIGVGLTVLYFALAEFFAVNARALNTKQEAAGIGTENAEDATATDEREKSRLLQQ